MTTFGDIRSLCEHTPSQEHFELLLTILKEAATTQDESQIEQEWIPYIQNKLDVWPSRLRCCPLSDLEAVESEPLFWTPLVKGLAYNEEGLNKHRIARLLKADHLSHVEHVNFGACRVKWPMLLDLAKNSPLTQLKSLGFRRNTRDKEREFLAEFLSAPMFAQVESLSLAYWTKIKPFTLEVLAEHFPLENLKRLDLTACNFSRKRLREFLQTGKLYGLEELIMGDGSNDISFSHAITSLAALPDFTSLRVLEVAEPLPSDFKAFAKASHLSSLTHLTMTSKYVEDDGTTTHLATLLAAPVLQNLEHLEVFDRLSTTRLDQGIAALASQPDMPRLHALNLRGSKISHDSLEALCKAPWFEHVKSFTLSGSRIPGVGHCIGSSPHTNGMKELSLHNTNLQSEDLIALSQSPHLSSLRHLDLSSNRELGEEGFQALGKAECLNTLTHLDLADTHIDKESLAAILDGLDDAALTSLNVRSCQIWPEEMTFIAECKALEHLTELCISPGNLQNASYITMKEVMHSSPYISARAMHF